MPLAKGNTYTTKDIYELPDGKQQGFLWGLSRTFCCFLNRDGHNYLEPDISVICDADKLNEYDCNGAPDWIIEIVSPSSQRMDYQIKLSDFLS